LIQITPQIRILVAVEPIDARKGIDSLAQLCREKLASDPFSRCLFIFRSRRGTAIKLLAYDGQGFWLATKRLSKGRFRWWPTGDERARVLRAHQAQLLLAAGNPEAEAPPEWPRKRLRIKHKILLAFQIRFWQTDRYAGRAEVPWPSHYTGRHRLSAPLHCPTLRPEPKKAVGESV
jgi:transposase